MSELILVINCGSSSIKFALFDAASTVPDRKPVWNGKINGITESNPTFGETGVKPSPVPLDPSEPYSAATDHIVERVDSWRSSQTVKAVAHRVVHGGSRYFKPVRVNTDLLVDLRSFIPLAPLHQPFAFVAIERLLTIRR